MKRSLSLITVLALFLLAGCTGKVNETEPTEGVTEPTEIASETAETAKYDVLGNDRTICVMIDNDSNDSRPHAGIEDAYLIYEMYVEGRATRLMAAFKGTDTKKIGPVRSSRHYFLDYALDSNALYAHAGWSPQAMEQIPKMGVNNLNGLVYEPKYYWRERKYKGDYHSLYTSIENLKSLAKTLGYKTTSDELPFNFTAEEVTYEGERAEYISIPYADFYKVEYKYNEDTNLYERYINGEYHTTQSGSKLYAAQIVIQFANNYNIGDGTARQQLETVGEGKGILIKDGIKVPLTWSRAGRTDKLRFFTEDGEEIKLTPREQTYVQVMPASLGLKIE